ncbi:MAG: hypothetical protein ABSA83_20210 [Verrucomicrobiota bacterium]|jgi:hypothetical protein
MNPSSNLWLVPGLRAREQCIFSVEHAKCPRRRLTLTAGDDTLSGKMVGGLTVRIPRIAPTVARELKYYVYLYINPLINPPDGSVFYVGKGKNGRALAHLRAGERKAMTKTLKAIRAGGKQPRIEILAHGLPTTDAAFKVEAAAIDLLGLKNLVNQVRGHGAKYGRTPLRELIARYTQLKANIRDPVILIRINKLYRYGMTDAELYDATRGVWRVGPKREKAEFALAVFEGVVREVYKIKHPWLPAGSTFSTRDRRGITAPRRWEFVGTVAEDRIRKRYVNRYVGDLFPHGAQNPISYFIPEP